MKSRQQIKLKEERKVNMEEEKQTRVKSKKQINRQQQTDEQQGYKLNRSRPMKSSIEGASREDKGKRKQIS